MTAPCVRSRCHECQAAHTLADGAACWRHAAPRQVSLTSREINALIRAERPGSIGPVASVAFAYVSGPIPSFTDGGERVY